MRRPGPRILPFRRNGGDAGLPRVGRVHRDGSITFQGKTYASLKDVPPGCLAVRPDQETYLEWKRMYRAVDPRRRRRPDPPAR